MVINAILLMLYYIIEVLYLRRLTGNLIKYTVKIMKTHYVHTTEVKKTNQ